MMILLFGVLNDEQRALVERIFHEHRVHFQRISFKIVKSEEAAEDVVSTAFVKIMDNIEKISELPCPQMTAFCVTIKGYLHNELEADADDEAAGNNRTHIAIRKVWKTVAVAAITLTLLFSTCMVANAQFRERVISWVIETFEKYSIFELHGDELDEPQDLTEYQAGYLPDGAILQDTTKQPNTEPGIVLYEYAINEAESFEIMITQSDNRVYFDTENTKIEPFDKGGVTGYFFQKDGMSYICFERDSCFFSVYGSIDTDELVKIAASITKK